MSQSYSQTYRANTATIIKPFIFEKQTYTITRLNFTHLLIICQAVYITRTAGFKAVECIREMFLVLQAEDWLIWVYHKCLKFATACFPQYICLQTFSYLPPQTSFCLESPFIQNIFWQQYCPSEMWDTLKNKLRRESYFFRARRLRYILFIQGIFLKAIPDRDLI